MTRALTFKQGKYIQTGFVQGMEQILGVSQVKVFTTLDDSAPVPVQYETNQRLAKRQSDRYDAVEADREDEEAGGFDWARQRYQRMFWETVPEGKVCLLFLSKARVCELTYPLAPSHALHFGCCHRVGHDYFQEQDKSEHGRASWSSSNQIH